MEQPLIKNIDEKILGFLKSANIENNIVRLTTQLDRTDYLAVNKVLESLGGKWNKKLKGHVFETNPSDLFFSTLDTGNYKSLPDIKKQFQAFFTPCELAEKLVDLADVSENHLILEPSAGGGNILVFLPGQNVHYCEIQPELVEFLKNNEQTNNCKFVGSDFLEYNPGPIYDRIIANPPFSKNQDINHVSHMIDCCKEGGKIVSIMSPSLTFKQNKYSKSLFEKLDDCVSYEIIKNESGSFKESGTAVETVTIIINR